MRRMAWRARAASGSRFCISVQAGGPLATTWPASRTSAIRPMRRPHSLRSITATSGGRLRPAISASSIQRKSEPYRSRLATLNFWRYWPGLPGIASRSTT